MNALWAIIEYFMCAIETILFFLFIRRFAEPKEDHKYIYRVISGVIVSFIIFVLTYIKVYSIEKNLISVILYFLIACVFFSGNLKIKIFSTILFFIAIFICDIVSLAVISSVERAMFREVIQTQDIYRFIGFSLSKTIFLIIITAMNNFKTKEETLLSNRYWVVFISIFSILLMLMLFILEIFVNSENFKYLNEAIVTIVMILFVFYFAYYFLFIKISEYYTKLNEMNMIEYHNEINQKYILQKEESEEDIKKLSHDLKNAFIYWEDLIVSENKEELLKNISEYRTKLATSEIIYTGNPASNVVINQKMVITKNNQIKFIINGSFEEKIFITSMDMCSLLGNLLDNAIEANLKIKDIDKRKIEVGIKNDNRQTFITITNAYEEPPIFINNSFKTAKENKKLHGLGTKIINSIVKKYNGTIKYEYENKKFTAFIMLEVYEK